jgi:phage gp46-like protein
LPEVISRANEGQDPLFAPPWDTVWRSDITDGSGGMGDWQLADATIEPNNVGGLQSIYPLETAILLQLFTDARSPDYVLTSSGPRGWHGDTFDVNTELNEAPMGSLLWTLEQGVLNADTARKAKAYATQALQTLIAQKVVADIKVDVEIDPKAGRLNLQVRCYTDNGTALYDKGFALFN